MEGVAIRSTGTHDAHEAISTLRTTQPLRSNRPAGPQSTLEVELGPRLRATRITSARNSFGYAFGMVHILS